jgi:GTP-binding protein HflX
VFERPRGGEKAVLVRLGLGAPVEQEDLDEFAQLAESAGVSVAATVTGKRDRPDPKYFVGSGKADEIRQVAVDTCAEVILVDHALSPSQERNLEKLTGLRVLDRNALILDIFAQRARSHEGKLEVELAQLRHLSSRLVRGWTHLERQKGGIGLRGPGESQIETDRRIIQQRIALMKERLREIDKQMTVQRSNRGQLVRVALVGYTNVGKSTIMNLLSKSDVFAENKLFATLDTTVRKVVIDNMPLLLTDTVGFIRKLPQQLMESFKSTLDEVREADLLVHVLDIAHPNFEEHFEVVNETLNEIDNTEKPTIIVFNKIDAYQPPLAELNEPEEDIRTLDSLKKSWMSKMGKTRCVFISATDKENVEELKQVLYEEVKAIFKVRYPYNNFLY